MLSKYKIFMFHFKNNLRTMQSILLFIFFGLATFFAVTFLHSIQPDQMAKSDSSPVCIQTSSKELAMIKLLSKSCKNNSDKVSVDIKNRELVIRSNNIDIAETTKDMITDSFVKILGSSHMLPFESIKTDIINDGNDMASFPVYSLILFYVMLFSGMIIVSSIALEKVNKLRLMTQFKLSSDFLVFAKIFAVFLQLAILIGLSVGTLFYFNSINYINLSNFGEIFKIKTNL